MRLLHTSTYELKTFLGQHVPRYAILSHTWGEDEFVFEDVQRGIKQHLDNPGRGLRKILDTCKQATRDGFKYVWVDTCCIDKSSSAELSEAINSMFNWYKNSAACYVFMEDVTLEADGTMTNFESSRWFTRGWTLQELIAPHGVDFFDRSWNHMYNRHKLADRISAITGVDATIMRRVHGTRPTQSAPVPACPACGNQESLPRILSGESIAGKMKWAANRTTTREEDMAYCLMGIFDINMPLLYGEGRMAFQRLQEELLRTAPDQTILTWTEPYYSWDSPHRVKPYLPQMPSAFKFEVYRRDTSRAGRRGMVSTPRGLEVDVLLVPCTITARRANGQPDAVKAFQLAVLSCLIEVDHLARVAIFVSPLQGQDPDPGYRRENHDALVVLRPGAEPEVVGQLNEYYNPLKSPQSAKVTCNFENFAQQTILLSNTPPQIFGLYNTPQVQLDLRAPDGWAFRCNSSNAMEDMVLHRCGSALVSTLHIKNVKVLDALFFSNLESGFFVLWGVHHTNPKQPFVSPDPRLVCWVENWASFLDGKLSGTKIRDVTYRTARSAKASYVERFDAELQNINPEAWGDGFHARATIVPCNFLGRESHKVLVEIESSGKNSTGPGP